MFRCVKIDTINTFLRKRVMSSLSELCAFYEQNHPKYYGYYTNYNTICFIIDNLEYLHSSLDESYSQFEQHANLIIKRRFINPEKIIKKPKK